MSKQIKKNKNQWIYKIREIGTKLFRKVKLNCFPKSDFQTYNLMIPKNTTLVSSEINKTDGIYPSSVVLCGR